MKTFLCIIYITVFSFYGNAQNKVNSSKKEILIPVSLTGKYIERIVISKTDSSLTQFGNIRKDYRTFGYEKPDIKSKKMILFSVFTDYVKDNPFKCPLGSYYHTAGMEFILKFVAVQGSFVKTIAIKDDAAIATVYFLRKCVEFEK